MKNTFNFNLGSINITIEGTPISIENFNMEYTNEASVQELATSASFIKDLVSEIKTLIKDAQTTANATTKAATKEVLPAGTFDDRNLVKKTSKEPSTKWDLPGVWEVLMSTLPEGFDKVGVGSYVYTYERENETGKTVKTTIKLAFNDSIDMRVYTGDSSASFYLYEDSKRSWIDGINECLVEDLLDELPANVRDFVRNFVKKVLTK